MNLILALGCLIGGAAMLVHERLTGATTWRIRGTDLSAGWLLIVLAVYNLVRWWSIRSQQKTMEDVSRQRLDRSTASPDPNAPAPDPAFDFTDKPKAPPPGP
jgi:hypothetical protein